MAPRASAAPPRCGGARRRRPPAPRRSAARQLGGRRDVADPVDDVASARSRREAGFDDHAVAARRRSLTVDPLRGEEVAEAPDDPAAVRTPLDRLHHVRVVPDDEIDLRPGQHLPHDALLVGGRLALVLLAEVQAHHDDGGAARPQRRRVAPDAPGVEEIDRVRRRQPDAVGAVGDRQVADPCPRDVVDRRGGLLGGVARAAAVLQAEPVERVEGRAHPPRRGRRCGSRRCCRRRSRRPSRPAPAGRERRRRGSPRACCCPPTAPSPGGRSTSRRRRSAAPPAPAWG